MFKELLHAATTHYVTLFGIQLTELEALVFITGMFAIASIVRKLMYNQFIKK